MEGERATIRDHLERLMPPGGRMRGLVGGGVVAWTGIGLVLLLWVSFRILDRVAGVFPYLVMAALVVLILNPAVRRLSAMGLPRRLAATVVFAAAVVLSALLIDLLIPVLANQTRNLINASPEYLLKGGGVFHRLGRSSNPLLHQVGKAGYDWLQGHATNAPQALHTVTTAGLKLAHAGLVLILGGFLGFLLLLSLPETARGLAAMIPPGSRARVLPTLTEFRRILSGYVRARLIVSAAVGVIATLGLWAIHMPFWLVLGIVVGVANLIPMLGSWIGGVPVALVSLLTRPVSYLFVVLAVVVVAHVIDGFILSPIILRETTDLHPVVVVLAVLVGAELFGFWGILAAIPVAGVIQFGLREWVVPKITGMERVREPVPLGEPPQGVPG